jgi:hypothetical protein
MTDKRTDPGYGEPPGLNWSNDIAQADWILSELNTGQHGKVDSLVPRVFPVYARILHSAWTRSGDPVRWRDVAKQTGCRIHPLVQFDAIRNSVTGDRTWQGRRPDSSLSQAEVAALEEILSEPNLSEECWFCLWDGYSWSTEVEPHGGYLKVNLRELNYFLYSGPITVAGALFYLPLRWPIEQTPNLWWTESRQWCVATDVDLKSTYVGGCRATIEAILDSESLEAVEVSPDDYATLDSDVINSPSRLARVIGSAAQRPCQIAYPQVLSGHLMRDHHGRVRPGTDRGLECQRRHRTDHFGYRPDEPDLDLRLQLL